MADTVDGSIRIDTSIDSDGMNKGIGKIQDSFRGLVNRVLDGIKQIPAGFASILEKIQTKFKGVGESASNSAGNIGKLSSRMLELLRIVFIIGGAITAALGAFALFQKMSKEGVFSNIFSNLGAGAKNVGTTLLSILTNPDVRSSTKFIIDSYNRIKSGAIEAAKATAQINTEATKVNKSFGGLGGTFDKLKGTLKQIFVGILFVFALKMRDIMRGLRDAVQDAANLQGGAIKEKFAGFKGTLVEIQEAMGAAFLPLVEVALPYLQKAADWLLKVFNYVAMITAALLGQKQVLQIIPGSAAKLAKETEKAKKAAEGALAAFDQINVLTQQTAETESMAKVEAQMVPVTDDVLKKVADLKAMWDLLWSDPLALLRMAWEGFKSWIKFNVIDPVWQWFKTTWVWKDVIEPLKNWFVETWENVKLGAEITWLIVSNLAGIALAKIQELWKGFIDWFTVNVFVPLVANFGLAWVQIQIVWANVSKWFNDNVATPLQLVFSTALDWIGNKFHDMFVGIQNFVFNTVNRIAGFINDIINSVLDGINSVLKAASSVSGAFNIPSMIGGGISGLLSSFHIPGFATGAIVPAHSNMLAMVGEGSQPEIVAPDDKIRQIIREELGNANGGGTIDNTIVLDGEVLYKATKRVERRHGASLIAGGTV